MKLRRPPGMGFAQWSAMLLESYRKLQRSLVRARASGNKLEKTSMDKVDKKTASEPQSEPASPGDSAGGRARCSPTSPTSPHGEGQRAGLPQQADQAEPGDGHQYAELLPQDDPDAGRDWHDRGWHDRWSPAEWRDWLGRKEGDSGSESDEAPWDELEQDAGEVPPDEILGWLLLPCAGLSAQARLAVQAATQNSLRFRDIEQALRDQEEELLMGEHQQQQQPRHRRSFWVEEDRSWGLVAVPDGQPDEMCQDIHAVDWPQLANRCLPACL